MKSDVTCDTELPSGRYCRGKFVFESEHGVRFCKRHKPRQERVAKPLGDLTGREVQYINCIVEGLTNKEISVRLGVTEKTVKNQLSIVFRKVSIVSRTQLAVYALRNGIVE